MLQDLRYALRSLRKAPGFAVASISVLALGIGANTAIFSVVEAVLIRPLPFADSPRLVRLEKASLSTGAVKNWFSPEEFRAFRSQNHAFDNLAMYAGLRVNLTGLGQPESLPVAAIDPAFLPMLGISAELGRVFRADEARPGSDRVALISDAFWKTRVGASGSIVGRDITLDDETYRVVGVLPPSFHLAVWFPASVSVWIPLTLPAQPLPGQGGRGGAIVGHLAAGVSQSSAQAELNSISSHVGNEDPGAHWQIRVGPLREYLVHLVRPTLLALLGAVTLVLLIAVANVASLILVRVVSRAREMAIRASLGASRRRLLQQMLCETCVVSAAGGVLGLVLAALGLNLLVASFASTLPRLTQVRIDYAVLAFTLATSLSTAVFAAFAPGFRLLKTHTENPLARSLRAADLQPIRSMARQGFIVVEISLATMLLIGAGWMIRSLDALHRVELGFDPRNVLTMTLAISEKTFPTEANRAALTNSVLTRLRALPGVVSAGSVDILPVSWFGNTQRITLENPSRTLTAEVRSIGPGYLSTMGIPIQRGRDVLESDRVESSSVVLMSASAARRLWGEKDPIGKSITLSESTDVARTVVGVVPDARLLGLGETRTVAALYLPAAQSSIGSSLVVRARSSPRRLEASVLRAIHEVAPDVPLAGVATMEKVLSDSLGQERFRTVLLDIFGAVALVLASVGVSSVLSYTIRCRSKEIGIRLALGAQPRDVLKQILFEGLRPVSIGAALGIFGALALGRVISNQLFGIRTTDPTTMAAVSGLLAAVGLLASLLPARRAARIDPSQALREG